MPATPTGYPAFRTEDGGIYVVCTTANTGYNVAVPANAKGFKIWFEQAAATPTLVTGRAGVDGVSTAPTVTNVNTTIGYVHPDGLTVIFDRKARSGALYLHVANNTALAVCRGMWFY